jgi:hypothetical protein
MSATQTETLTESWVHYHDGGVPGRRRVLKGKAAKETFNEVPKIDFQRIYSDKLEDRKELAKEVGNACRSVGFFYAVNHGVDEEMLNDTFQAMEKFFGLPNEVKMEIHNQKTEKFRGYEAFLEGKLDPSTRGGQSHHPPPHYQSLLTRIRPQRGVPHGRRRHRPGAKPPYHTLHIQTPQPMAHAPLLPLLAPRYLPLL